MKANSWLYHYYMVQSRLQYDLAYGAHSPSLAAYYPHMLGAPPQPQPFTPYDPNPHPITPAYLSGSHHSGFGSTTPLYPSYLYTPPPATHYHLPPAHAEHSTHISVHDSKEHASGPLDFSKDFSSRSQDYTSQQSSPSLRSDTSSSPVYQPPHESLYGAPEVALLTQGSRHNSSEHHYKSQHSEFNTKHRTEGQTISQPRRDHSINSLGFWSDVQLSGFDKYKSDSENESDRKRVKKETDYYSSDTNNNTDGPPTYYSLDQMHLP